MAYNEAKVMWLAGPGSGKARLAMDRAKKNLARFVELNLTPERLQKDYDQCSPKDRLAYGAMILQYILPKAADQSAIDNLSDKQADEILNKLMTKIRNENKNQGLKENA